MRIYDTEIKKGCPFCGKKNMDLDHLIGKWALTHRCDEDHSNVTLYGKTRQDVIDKWEKRV